MKSVFFAGVAMITIVSGAFAADYYVTQDSGSKRCSVIEQKPSTNQMTLVGDGKAYQSKSDADAAMASASACKTAMNATPTTTAAVLPTEPRIIKQVPTNVVPIKHYYSQTVYDPAGAKIGEIEDVLLTHDGKISALVVGVGGFLGMGEKYVLVPFTAVASSMKDSKVHLMMNTTKDELKSAPGVKMDSAKTAWIMADAGALPAARR